jgi:hypothetical protein
MPDRTITRERLDWEGTPFPLGRHLNHDSMSRAYPYRVPRKAVLRTVQHQRHVGVFDQGDLGSCTGNAAVGCLGTGPFWATMNERDAPFWPLNQAAAVRCYSDATRIDPFRGVYPPDDTGSDGLSVAKVLKAAGAISGYEHAFGLEAALAALMDRPWITGTMWFDGMFNPDGDGIVHATGRPAGGHEYLGDGYDAERGLVWFTNSWGPSWGKGGRFAMQAEEFADLLAQNGDVTVFVPVTEPAPAPVGDPDAVLAAAVGSWARKDTAVTSARQRAAVRAWLDAKGL